MWSSRSFTASESATRVQVRQHRADSAYGPFGEISGLIGRHVAGRHGGQQRSHLRRRQPLGGGRLAAVGEDLGVFGDELAGAVAAG